MERSDLAHLPGRGVQISQLAQHASLYRPGAARGWEGGGRPGGRGGGGSRTAPSAAPPAGPEKRAFGPGSWAHLGRRQKGAPGTDAQGPRRRLRARAPAEVLEQVSHPQTPDSPRDSGSLEKGVEWPRSMGDA